jgi:hypothetical protein
VNAELSARITAARAALSDYRREQADEDMVGLAAWSARLAGLLGELLDELDRTDPGGTADDNRH